MVTKTKEPNGKIDLPNGWQDWPGITRVCTELSVPSSWVYKMASEGEIDVIVDPRNNSKRYSPDGVQKLREFLSTDAGKAELTPRSQADEMKAANELVKFTVGALERLVPILVSGFESAAARQVEQSERDQAAITKREERIAALEAERDEASKARRAELDNEHAQRMQERAFEASERRKDRALGILENRALPILVKKFGLDSDPRVGLGLKLASSIKREQLLMLLAIPGIIDEKQREIVMGLLGELSPEEKAGIAEVSGPSPDVPKEEKK